MFGKYRLAVALVGLVLLGALYPGAGALQAEVRAVYVLDAVGSVNPGMVDYLKEGIRQAEREKAEALVIRLDTPGGLEDSMRQIDQAIINSNVPVIVYISPKGARAASAGVFLTIAAHLNAMAPGTNIGAAHPVSIGMGKMDKVMGEKVVNDMVASGRALALERGRNADWVEKAVRKSVSIDAAEAVRLKVVDLMADDLNDLLAKANGRTVKVGGRAVTLHTLRVPVREIQEGWRTNLLRHIADPNVAFILMLLGLAGLYFELAHPGAVLPGVVGALCLLLAFYAFQTLPVNFIGVLLIILGFVFFLLEIYIISHGLLSLAGIVSLFLGATMLFGGGGGAGMEVAWSVLIPAVLIISAFFIAVAWLVVRVQRRRALTGGAGLVGEHGTAFTDLTPNGRVFVHGEYWRATSAGEPIKAGEGVEVMQVDSLKLLVRRAK